MKRAAFATTCGAIVAQAPTDTSERPSIQVMHGGSWTNLLEEDIEAMKQAIAFIESSQADLIRARKDDET